MALEGTARRSILRSGERGTGRAVHLASMNTSQPRSEALPPRVEPNAPDPGERHPRPDPEGEPVDPREHPLVELPPATEPEIPGKPQRDLPYADPQRAAADSAEVEALGLADTDPEHQPWQAPAGRSPWMTQPLRAMPLRPLPLPSMPR